MKTISTQAIIEGIRSKKDRSLGLNLSTPELTIQEKALFMEMQGINVSIQITPIDEPTEEDYKIATDLDQKSQSQRMRSVLYILWNQGDKSKDFADYYRDQTEKIIEYLKQKIEE